MAFQSTIHVSTPRPLAHALENSCSLVCLLLIIKLTLLHLSQFHSLLLDLSTEIHGQVAIFLTATLSLESLLALASRWPGCGDLNSDVIQVK